MAPCSGRKLRPVGNEEDLAVLGKVRQPFSHPAEGQAADARVHFVEIQSGLLCRPLAQEGDQS